MMEARITGRNQNKERAKCLIKGDKVSGTDEWYIGER
jgi:hypothetical protein